MPRLKWIAAVLCLLLPLAAKADEGTYPIAADDGEIIANHPISPELEAQLAKLSDTVVAGNPNGRITLTEFYDVNCGYCRAASPDLDAMLRTNPELRLVLVPFPVLGVPSVLGTRVELAVMRLTTPEKFYQFHRLLDQTRGTVDGMRAIATAQQIGLDPQQILKIANDPQFAEVMKAHLHMGDALQVAATPGFIIKGVVIVGYPGPKSMANVIRAVGACGAVICKSGAN
ncbi:MAG TPA: thioredoxin domain-containing protein [Pseudolabrys sp.]|nr:thioredoxin domain-containing protein [Pseudolabrys sp.]